MNKDMLICSSFKVATLNAFLCYCLSGRFVDVQKSLLRINYITLSTAVLYRFNKAEKQAWKSYQCFSHISCMIDELTSSILWFVSYITHNMLLCNEMKYLFNKFLSAFKGFKIKFAHNVSLNYCESHLKCVKTHFSKIWKHFSNNVINKISNFLRSWGNSHFL